MLMVDTLNRPICLRVLPTEYKFRPGFEVSSRNARAVPEMSGIMAGRKGANGLHIGEIRT